METRNVYAIGLSEVQPYLWYGRAVYENHDQLRAIVKARVSEDAARLFTRPLISADALASGGEGRWAAAVDNPVALTSLPPAKRAIAVERLSALLKPILDLAEELRGKSDPAQRELGELLPLAVEVPGWQCVFVDGDAILLAAWGFYPREGGSERFRLIRSVDPARDVEEPPLPKDHGPERVAENVPPVEETALPPPRRRRRWWVWALWALAVLIVAALIAGGWFLYNRQFHKAFPAAPGLTAPDPAKAARDETDPLKRRIIINRLLLTLRDGVDVEAFARGLPGRAGEIGLTVVGYRPETGVVQVEFRDGEIARARALLSALPEVEGVAPDVLVKPDRVPNDAGFGARTEEGVPEDWGQKAIGAPAAWDRSMGKPGVLIAIIDAGFQGDHPEFRDKRVAIHRMRDGASTPAALAPLRGHGTHTSGIAAAKADNGIGVAGVCPECSILMIDVSAEDGSLPTSMIYDAIVYAANQGADAINMSLGAGPEVPEIWRGLDPESAKAFLEEVTEKTRGETVFWDRAFRLASRRGVVVQSAGNNSAPAALDPMTRTGRSLVVGAFRPDSQRAEFSNFGDNVKISAPGVAIYSSFPGNAFKLMDGTSMAAPFVTGAAGLLKSINPALSSDDIKTILISTASKPPADESRATTIGGRLNLAAAAEAAAAAPGESPKPTPPTPTPEPTPSPAPKSSPTPSPAPIAGPSPSPEIAPPSSGAPMPAPSIDGGKPAPVGACDCAELNRRIADLERRLGALEGSSPSGDRTSPVPGPAPTPTPVAPPEPDKLTIPKDSSSSLDFAEGRWRASDQLFRTSDKAKIDLVFDIKRDGTGQITFEEPGGSRCRAPLDLRFNKGELSIVQKSPAPCSTGTSSYNRYRFTCKSGGDDKPAECSAQALAGGADIITFTMIRER